MFLHCPISISCCELTTRSRIFFRWKVKGKFFTYNIPSGVKPSAKKMNFCGLAGLARGVVRDQYLADFEENWKAMHKNCGANLQCMVEVMRGDTIFIPNKSVDLHGLIPKCFQSFLKILRLEICNSLGGPSLLSAMWSFHRVVLVRH